MDRASILETLDRFWVARVAGDKAALLSFASPDAIYEMVGAKSFADPATAGPAPIGPAADRLVDDFKFHRVERLSAIVEGSRAAVVNRLEISFRGGAPVTTEACDLLEFDEAGKVTSLRQFVDTALVRSMMGSRA